MSKTQNPTESEQERMITIHPDGSTEITEKKRELAESRPTTSVLRRVGETVLSCYDPQPMKKPEIEPGLRDLPVFVRLAVTCRWGLAKALYPLSSGGRLQAWWRFLIRGLLVVVPALLAIKCILWPVQWATLTLQQIAINLAGTAVAALITVVAVYLAISLIKRIFGFGR